VTSRARGVAAVAEARRAARAAALAGAIALLAGCGAPGGGAGNGGGSGGQAARYLPPAGQGVAAADQNNNPFVLGKLLQGTVKTSALQLPAPHPSGDVSFTAAAVANDPSADPALSDPAWRKAGAFCLDGSDGQMAAYPSAPLPSNPAAYVTCGYGLWSPAHLDIAFVVTDPQPHYFVSDTAWENAAVELYFGVNGQNMQWMNDFGILANGQKVGPVTSVPGATLTAALTDKGYILALRIPWSTLGTRPAKGVSMPFNIQTDVPTADGSADRYYFGNGTKPAGADVSTFGTLTLG
jgi:hypothetical protein